MAKTKLETMLDLTALPDPFLSDNWLLTMTEISKLSFAEIDGKMPVGSASALQIQCKSISLPGVTNEVQEVLLHGYKIAFAGKTSFQGTMSITFVERGDLLIYNFLRMWVNAARDSQTQTSASGKAGYAVGAELKCFSANGRDTAKTIQFKGLWCNEVSDITLDSSSANLIDVTANFRYDNYICS